MRDGQQWEHKIGGRLQGFFPALLILAVFGGVTAWMYLTKNGVFPMGALLTLLAIAVVLGVVYRKLFCKVLVYRDHIYFQSAPGNGREYRYSEITEAWVSTAQDQSWLNFKTADGRVHKMYLPSFEDDDGADFLVKRVREIHGIPEDEEEDDD